ncbi:hypothetical protein [Martelella mediterranea]|uniref:Uncharacterized protein n=1 Tax=Martelella mediterranea TaxID=293089 RepID=A0A4R3NP44_9HYPH|nr:hypothetical protein [Martelella mediterranea]TCT37271.1 hypothetical protein EDC90_10198 [Martelella mediterranea]
MELSRLNPDWRKRRFGDFAIGKDFRHAPDRFQREARLLQEEMQAERHAAESGDRHE